MCFRKVSGLKNQRGAILVIVAVALPLFLGLAALAVDLSLIYLARNELQNAADAGALAGARFLYINGGTEINTGANQLAYDAATTNRSFNDPVEVYDALSNNGDVQRGHWSHATRTFTPNPSTALVALWGVTTEQLDANLNFINAVRVITRREQTPVGYTFARLWGAMSKTVSAEAVAYIGFSGTLEPEEIDMPIAICMQAILKDGAYDLCTVGRMINSGGTTETHQTGGWTSFEQADNEWGDGSSPCTGGTNANFMKTLVNTDCGKPPDYVWDGTGDPIYSPTLVYGADIATNGGEIESAFDNFRACWLTHSNGGTMPWQVRLPVVNCDSNNVGTCEKLMGVVEVWILWVTGKGADPGYLEAPLQMGAIPDDNDPNSSFSGLSAWDEAAQPDGQVRWNDFVTHYTLQNVTDSGTQPAPYAMKSIYFLPVCKFSQPAGLTGGVNFGILAEIPVLVR